MVELLPTPTTSEGTGAGHAAQGGMNLRHTISLLPTPTATRPATTANYRADGTPYSDGYGMTLLDAARLLPTPRASARENRQTKRSPTQKAGKHGLCLAAEMSELSSGASTVRPSTAGSASLAALRPLQLTIEDALQLPSSSG
ncbi:hypothetical protein [Nonomuraea endophytica]|uniref:Uncharacterized protein n=1 Tax=Nonomuraea endophytica TaxID=714136 RepID=A0A7W8AG01_9ACTN|nr:hypothetical protein [Nonomuraea endophytica]MBB5085054.1 hypothetical protein [Nonomuraea endophytica]